MNHITYIAVVLCDDDMMRIAVIKQHPDGRHEIGIMNKPDFPAEAPKSTFPQFLEWAKENGLKPSGDANRPGMYVFYPPESTRLQTHLAMQEFLLWAGVKLPNVIE